MGAIRALAEGNGGDGESQPQTVDEALLLGTTLASAPTSAQRRIQQSLLLAQELQRRTRDLGKTRSTLKNSDIEVERLKEELEVTKKELQYGSEPQAYLLEALRRREHEVLDLRRQLRSHEAELERSRRQMEHVTSSKISVEEDLKKVLAQRQHLDGLRAILSNGRCVAEGPGDGEAAKVADPALRAEHRGRAPSQQ